MAANLFLSVLEISISTGFIVLILMLLSPFLNMRYAAKWKYWIWLFLALRLIVPISGTDVWTIADNIAKKMMKTEADVEKEGSSEEDADAFLNGPGLNGIGVSRRVIVEIPEQMTVPLEVRSEKSGVRITALDVVAALWLAGCLLILSVHTWIYLHYKNRLMKSGMVLKDTVLLHRIKNLKRELHIRKSVSVVESPEAASPMIIGIFKTVLVLPEEEYGEEELFFILKHELVHLQHKDLYGKLLFVVASALHWFNPCIWLLQKEAVVDMELYCDESVVQGANYAGRKAYTETLLSTLHRQCAKRTVLSTQFYGGKKIMQKRFKNILSRKRKKNGLAVLVGAVFLTVTLGTLIGCSVVRESSGEDAAVGGKNAAADRENAAGGEENAAQAEDGQTDADMLQTGNGESASGGGENLPDTEVGKFEQMEGRWVIDFTVTDSSLWGSGISYGNEMEISASGEFRYYIGIGVGGTGQCEETQAGITVAIQPYEENLAEQEILTLNYVNQEGDEYIQMDWHGEAVRWRREENAAASSYGNAQAAGQMPENTAVLTFMLEGEEEQVPASLVTGEGYSFYLPDDEWQQSDSDMWTALANEQVRFWIARQDGKTLDQMEQELSNSGFVEINGNIWRQEGEMIDGVELKALENGIWGVYYRYPVDAEEGWGRRILVIADTLAAAE